jgi:uncharacterized protein
MSAGQNVQTVEDFFAAAFGGHREAMLALVAEDIEWIIPGEDWPPAGTHRGHAGLTDLLKTESETMELSLSEPREFVAQGDRLLVVGFARGRSCPCELNFYEQFQSRSRRPPGSQSSPTQIPC